MGDEGDEDGKMRKKSTLVLGPTKMVERTNRVGVTTRTKVLVL